LGIVVSGGPAPGINSVISSVVIEAHNQGFSCCGLLGGFEAITYNSGKAFIPLKIEDVSRIANLGGSILGTSRFNPIANDESKKLFQQALSQEKIAALIVVGGEGSAYLSHQINKSNLGIRVVHVPKTIDNDLILPHEYPSFGFETARYVGTNILRTLSAESKTSQRWFIVNTMGRNAGFLALGMGLAAGATLTLIPEEFKKDTKLEDVCSVIQQSIEKRVQSGKNYGLAVIAEGIIDKLDSSDIPQLRDCTRDKLGRIQHSEIRLEDLVASRIRSWASHSKQKLHVTAENIGYELRCHDPVAFDLEYTKMLGFGAVKFIAEGKSGVMVVRDYDRITYRNLEDLCGPDGKINSRTVNLSSDFYMVARSYMIR
ncbi:MAG: 6-phosphofructokinase, partial [Bdellovibrionales bacterium]|nr:6-phosphofructokinase [Bdellovibrionales bacterium]